MKDNELEIALVGVVESTNALALEAIEQGAAEGTVFVADRQTAGRGRREAGGGRRQWFSPPGRNLYWSAVVRPAVSLEKSSGLTLAVGAGLVEALRAATPLEVMLKWPNDLYVGEKKLGGILTEGVTGPKGLEAAAIGVGLNVNVEGSDFPEPLADIATSLREETGRRHDRLSLALALPQAVVEASREYAAGGLEAFAGRLSEWDYLRGRSVRVEADGDERIGTACGIAAGGALRVEFGDRSVQEVVSGEVRIRHRKSD